LQGLKQIKEIHKLSLGPNDLLIVNLGKNVTQDLIQRARENLRGHLKTNHVIVVSDFDNLSFIKLHIEEHLADEIILKAAIDKKDNPDRIDM
jgi:hypothetical protein